MSGTFIPAGIDLFGRVRVPGTRELDAVFDVRDDAQPLRRDDGDPDAAERDAVRQSLPQLSIVTITMWIATLNAIAFGPLPASMSLAAIPVVIHVLRLRFTHAPIFLAAGKTESSPMRRGVRAERGP